ncbi:unnamed protein product [Urochloa humidicola]
MEAREGTVMFAMKGSMTVKEDPGSDPGERPAKIIRQTDGSVAGTMPFEGSFWGDAGAGSSCGGGSGSGVNQSASSFAFVNISSGDCSAFDCSALAGALRSDLLVESDIPEIIEDAPPADVFVPGAARPVLISKQVILKEIARNLHLELHDFGTFDESGGLVRGFIEMDIPRRLAGEPKMKELFVGDDVLSRYDAMESASAEAIKGLCKRSGVIIQDINYDEMKKLESKLVNEKQWSKLFCDQLQVRIKKDGAIRSCYENVVAHAKTICKEFKDVLPIEITGEQDLFLGMDNVKVVYNGPRCPVTRMDHLAFDLVSFVKKSVNLQIVARQEKTDHVPAKRKRYRCRG